MLPLSQHAVWADKFRHRDSSPGRSSEGRASEPARLWRSLRSGHPWSSSVPRAAPRIPPPHRTTCPTRSPRRPVSQEGLFRELNPGPLAPEARIIPLDQTAGCYPQCFWKLRGCQKRRFQTRRGQHKRPIAAAVWGPQGRAASRRAALRATIQTAR